MDKRTFLTELKSRGKISTREDAVAAMQKWRDNGGTFSDEAPEAEQAAPASEKTPPAPPATVGEQIKSLGTRTMERARAIEAPTALGDMAKVKRGGVMDAIVGTPERAMRLGLGAVGTLADVAATPFTVAASGYNQMLGGVPGKAAGAIAERTGLVNLGQMYGKFKEELPESARANFVAIESGLGALGMKGGFGAAGAVKQATGKAMAGKGTSEIVKEATAKGLRPGTKVTKEVGGIEKFENDVHSAAQSIVENKKKIEVFDDAGRRIDVPSNLQEFRKAIPQAKKAIWDEVEKLSSGAAKVEFDAKEIDKMLVGIAENVENLPEYRSIANGIRKEMAELDGMSPKQVQTRLKQINAKLDGFYKGRGNTTTSEAAVYHGSARIIRKKLDEQIAEAIGGQGGEYQQLKNKYGALSSIENEVEDRAIVHARRNKKGLADFADIGIAMEIVGAATGNPIGAAKAAAAFAVKQKIKHDNNPDTYIKRLFQKVDSDIKKSPLPKPKTYQGKEVGTAAPLPISTGKPAYQRAGVDIEKIQQKHEKKWIKDRSKELDTQMGKTLKDMAKRK